MALSTEEIHNLIDGYEKESKALKKMIFKQCWYMRGGLSLDEGWSISPEDREIINQIVGENLDLTKESGLPFF